MTSPWPWSSAMPNDLQHLPVSMPIASTASPQRRRHPCRKRQQLDLAAKAVPGPRPVTKSLCEAGIRAPPCRRPPDPLGRPPRRCRSEAGMGKPPCRCPPPGTRPSLRPLSRPLRRCCSEAWMATSPYHWPPQETATVLRPLRPPHGGAPQLSLWGPRGCAVVKTGWASLRAAALPVISTGWCAHPRRPQYRYPIDSPLLGPRQVLLI